MLFNDVVDLPIDRTQPNRQRDPLVRGTIEPWQVMAVALVQPLLTVPLSMWLGATAQAHATLGAGFALMGAYNLWGKRCPFPPLTDAIQGMAWGSLALYGACAFGAPNRMTWMVRVCRGLHPIFNGIHGLLRSGRFRRPTAIFLGAHPS
jgi:4-hydroxybenzoate polyprenyltransferase